MAEKPPNAKTFRAMPEADLRAELDKVRTALWQSRQKMKDGSAPQMHQVAAHRRQIARILTVLNELRIQETHTPHEETAH